MAITNILSCDSNVIKAKKSACSFAPAQVLKAGFLKKGVTFDPVNDSFDDAKFTELTKCGQFFAVQLEDYAFTTPEPNIADTNGLKKKIADGLVELDLTFLCLDTCLAKEYAKIDNSYNLVLFVQDGKGEEKVILAERKDGFLQGLDVYSVYVKSNVIGNRANASTFVLTIQLSPTGTKQYNVSSGVYDIDVDMCDYNIQGVNLETTAPPTLVPGTSLTVDLRAVLSCNGSTPVEAITAPNTISLVDAFGNNIPANTLTDNGAGNYQAVWTLPIAGVVGGTEFDLALFDTADSKNVVEVDDLFYISNNPSIAI